MRFAVAVTLLLLLASPAWAADRYWVGGTGDWSDTGHWSASTGGAGGETAPTSVDDVFFDAASGTGTSTINGARTIRSLDCTGYTGTITHNSVILTIGAGTVFTLVAGMTYTLVSASSVLTFGANSGGMAITLAGHSVGNIVVNNNNVGVHTLQDALASTGTITLTDGALDTNGQAVSGTTFTSSNTNSRTLTLGASTITLSGTAAVINFNDTTGLTYNTNTSTWVLTGDGGVQVYGALTHNSLTRTGQADTDNTIDFIADMTFGGTLTLNGNSAVNRLLVASSSSGTARTITAAVVSVSNVDFSDITAAGAGDWDLSAEGVADCGGNTGITFTASVNRFWIGDSGNWYDTAEWSASTGGAGGASTPTCQDDVFFDANSFSTTGLVVTVPSNASNLRIGRTIDFSAATNNATFQNGSQVTSYIYGSLIFGADMTPTSNTWSLRFVGRSAYVKTSAGKTHTASVYIDMPGGSLTLQDDWSTSQSGSFTLVKGTFDANGFDWDVNDVVISGSSVRALNMGAGTLTVKGANGTSDTIYNALTTTNLTFNAETSTIVISGLLDSADTYAFTGGSLTYNNLTISTTQWAGSGPGAVRIRGSNTFNTLTSAVPVAGARTLKFDGATTNTFADFVMSGATGQLSVITSFSGTQTLTKSGGGEIACDYCDVANTTGSPADTWYACNGADSGGNTNWGFGTGPCATGDSSARMRGRTMLWPFRDVESEVLAWSP